MNNYIVSPCGTSLLTGCAETETRQLVVKYANIKDANDIEPGDRDLLQKRVQEVKMKLMGLGPNEVTRHSAELNALVRFYNGQFLSGDHHLLLCTDTWLGEQTANLIHDWLKGQNDKMTVEVYRQKDLQTCNMDAFHLALTELAEMFEGIFPFYRHGRWRIVFNLTGGFKSVQGFLQVLGMFYADEIIYIFESGGSLLRIPRLPITIDMEVIKKNLSLFRRLHARLLKASDAKRLPEIFVFKVGNEVDFSPWGKVIWNRAKENLYSERLWPEPVKYIRFSERFKRQMSTQPGTRIKEMNERIDQLVMALKDSEYNPRSLRFPIFFLVLQYVRI